MFEVNLATHGPTTRITLEGDLDTLASQQLDDWFETHAPLFTDDVEVDLSALSYLNSTGIRSFIRLDKLLKAQDRQFRFTGVTSRIFRIFRYCGLDAFFVFQYAVDVASEHEVNEGRPA